MNYLPSNLEFKDGVAFIGETSLLDVAKEYGTPLYVYDWEHLRDNIDYFTNAFGEETYFRYAAKAFICKALVKELDDKGWGVDVVSGGELLKVLNAGISPKKIVFSGVGKSTDELKMAIKRKIRIN